MTNDEAFREVLNSHGYAFHEAVIRTCKTARNQQRSRWWFESAEVPVDLGDRAQTRIDLVLRHSERPWRIIGECKRVNPAFGRWGFFKAARFSRPAFHDTGVFETIQTGDRSDQAPMYSTGVLRYAGNAYYGGIAIRMPVKGDAHRFDKDAIEEAAIQVSRGLNGFVNLICAQKQNERLIRVNEPTSLVPVIFTTAKLFVTDNELSAADVASGEVSVGTLHSSPCAWVALQYPLSPWLKNRAHPDPELKNYDLSELILRSSVRTIFIVNAEHIVKFLAWSSDWVF